MRNIFEFLNDKKVEDFINIIFHDDDENITSQELNVSHFSEENMSMKLDFVYKGHEFYLWVESEWLFAASIRCTNPFYECLSEHVMAKFSSLDKKKWREIKKRMDKYIKWLEDEKMFLDRDAKQL